MSQDLYILFERAFRYVGIGLPLLLLILVPSLRPEEWCNDGPWKKADPVFPFTFFLVMSFRLDASTLGGRLEQALYVLLPAFSIVPIFMFVAALLAAVGGAWACWVGVVALNITMVAYPMHVYGTQSLAKVAVWTNILAAEWSFEGPLDAALAAHQHGVGAVEVLRMLLWPRSYDSVVPPGMPQDFWLRYGYLFTGSSGLLVNWTLCVFATFLYCLALVLPPSRTGRKLLFKTTSIQLEKAASLRQQAADYLDVARKACVASGALGPPSTSEGLKNDQNRAFSPIGRNMTNGEHNTEAIPESTYSAGNASQGSDASDNESLFSGQSPTSNISWSAEVDAQAESQGFSLAQQCKAAFDAASLEPASLLGGRDALLAWSQLTIAAASAVDSARSACHDAAAVIQECGSSGQLPALPHVCVWSVEALDAARSLHETVAALLDKLDRRASPKELRTVAMAVRSEASRALERGIASAVQAARSNARVSILAYRRRTEPLKAAPVFARDAALLRMVIALIVMPTKVAIAAADVAEAQAKNGDHACVCLRSMFGPLLNIIVRLASDFCGGLNSTASKLRRISCRALVQPSAWSKTHQFAFKWLVGINLLWLLMLLSDGFRRLMTGTSAFAALTFVSFTSVFISTTDSAFRKMVLRLVGVIFACFLSMLGYFLFAWPEIWGGVGQSVVMTIYLLMLILLAIRLGMRKAPYEGGWHTWAYMCQKFTYTFAGIFLGAYGTGQDRMQMLNKVEQSAFAIFCGVAVGAFWGYLIHAVLWPTSSHALAKEECITAAKVATHAISSAATAFLGGGGGGGGADDAHDSLEEPCLQHLAVHVRKAAKAAKEHAKMASTFHKASLELAGEFFRHQGQEYGLKQQAETVRLTRRLAMATSDAASLMGDLDGVATDGIQVIRELVGEELDLAALFPSGVASDSGESAHQRSSPTLPLTVPVWHHPFFSGPPTPPEAEATAAKGTERSLRRLLVALCAVGDDNRNHADRDRWRYESASAAASLEKHYTELRHLRLCRLFAEGGHVFYPIGRAVRFHALCRLLCSTQKQLWDFWELQLGSDVHKGTDRSSLPSLNSSPKALDEERRFS